MSNTTNFNLVKPASTDIYNVEIFNGNMDIIDAELAKPPLTVNGIAPNATTRDLTISEVPLAGNLSSDIAQIVSGEFIQRTSGGDAPIGDGNAFIVSLKGNMAHAGYVEEVLDMEVDAVERDDPITATLNETTFKAYVSASAVITLNYIATWSADPTLYGVTVTGTPVNGDSIVITYVKGDRGTITPANPTAFNATGWNLFNPTAGYAKVVKYSTEYGYRIGGNYSLVSFAETISGTQSAVTLEDGLFNIPSDGYVFVTGADATTYIYPTWSDWASGYSGSFEAYSLETISLSEAMLAFPYGLCAVGAYRDEININAQTAIQRIERTAYENLDDVIAMGVPYECDTNYVYYVLETPVTTEIALDGEYTVSDHGIEYFSGTTVPVLTEILYGENLKDKLRTDVVTISEQDLTETQKAQVRTNIGLNWKKSSWTAYTVTATSTDFYEVALPELAGSSEIVGFIGSSTQMFPLHLYLCGSADKIACEFDTHLLINNSNYDYSVAMRFDKSNNKIGFRQSAKGSSASFQTLQEVWYR